MALMLNILEQEANSIYSGNDPDLELLDDVMYYMSIYPDAIHHPKEDRVYAELKAARPDLSEGFKRITVDHRRIEEMGLILRRSILSIASDQIVKRDSLVAETLRYVTTLRGHMQWEESDLFRRVDEMIADGHRCLDTAVFMHECDPVFGPMVEKRFEDLLARVRCCVDEATVAS